MSTALLALFGAFLLGKAAPAEAQASPGHCVTNTSTPGLAVTSSSPPAVVVRSEIVGYEPALVVPAGTAVALRMSEDLGVRGRRPRVGEFLRLEVAEPLQSNGRTVVPAGMPARAVVAYVGIDGGVEARLLHLRVHGLEIRLSGRASGALPRGARIEGVIDEDIVPMQAAVPIHRMVALEAGATPPPYPPAGAPAPPAASIVAPAQARADPASLVSGADYPASARQRREQGRVHFILEVGANGRIASCTITRSSGSSALDAATCRIMRARARFTPARDSNGNPASSRVDQQVSWTLPVGQ